MKRFLLRSTPLHALLWCLFAIIAVAMQGPMWEENYEFAQVLLGRIVYPPAHPLHLHAHNLFSLQVYLTALHVALGGDPFWVCGLRNVLYLLAKTLPFYFLGRWMSGRVAVGHLAALAAFLAAGEGFTHVYPTLAWPMFAGNGVIGTGAALLAAVCLVSQRYVAGFALAAAMPAIHMGQFPPVALLAVAVGLYVLVWGDARGRREMLLGAALGGGVTALSIAYFFYVRVPYVPELPYAADISGQAVWERSTAAIGGHHGLSFGIDQLLMLWSILLFSACAWIAPRDSADEKSRHITRGLLIYAVGLSALIWTLMAIHAAVHPHIPHLLFGWMPYRLANHLPPLIACAITGMLFHPAIAPGARLGLPIILAMPFFGYEAEDIFIALNALGLVAFAPALRPRWLSIPWLLLGVALWWWFLRRFNLDFDLFLHALCLSALLVLPDFLPRGQLLRARPLQMVTPAAAAVFLLLTLLLQPYWNIRNPVRPSAFDDAVRALEAEGQLAPGEILWVPHMQAGLQGRLNHPVTADYALASWIPYHPKAAPAIYAIHRDLYGSNSAPTFGERFTMTTMSDFAAYSTEKWRALGTQYNFRYVLMPDLFDVQLEQVVEADGFRLYRIPLTDSSAETLPPAPPESAPAS